MAGARLEIVHDSFTPVFRRAAEQLGPKGLELLLRDIGEHLLNSTRERARAEISPEGKKWQALSPRYRRQKDKKRAGLPILKLDDHLLGDRLSYQVSGRLLQVGTSAPYGAAHQFGHKFTRKARTQDLFFQRKAGQVANRFVKKKRATFAQTVQIGAHQGVLPARPFLGISQDDERSVLEIVAEHLSGAFS